MNCAMRPTLDDSLGRSVEINIFDFDYFAEKLTASVPESKAELRELNKKALLLGYNYAE